MRKSLKTSEMGGVTSSGNGEMEVVEGMERKEGMEESNNVGVKKGEKDVQRHGEAAASWYSNLDLISRKGLEPEFEKEMREKDLLNKSIIGTLIKEAESLAGLRCYGLDIIIDEGTLDHYIIDLNDMPSYIGVPPMQQRAFIKQWEMKQIEKQETSPHK